MDISQHVYPPDASCLQQATPCVSFRFDKAYISLHSIHHHYVAHCFQEDLATLVFVWICLQQGNCFIIWLLMLLDYHMALTISIIPLLQRLTNDVHIDTGGSLRRTTFRTLLQHIWHSTLSTHVWHTLLNLC